MKTSESIKEISKALLEVNKILKHPPANAGNPFYKSKYTTLECLVDYVKLTLSNNDLFICQSPECKDGYINLITRVIHVSGEWIETNTTVPMGSDAQKTGAAITYSRRYGLSAILNLSSETDNDGNETVDDKKVNTQNNERLDFNILKNTISNMNIEEINKHWLEISPGLTDGQKPYVIKIFAERKAEINQDHVLNHEDYLAMEDLMGNKE